MESSPHSKLYSSISPSLARQHSSSCSSSCVGGSSVGNGGFCYIEHTVSKLDTLAGVAIKYGVEVGDVKRMNGLTSDLQMFALKSLRIPLPGRHPPSPITSNGYDTQRPGTPPPPPNRRYSDSFYSIKSLKLSSSSQPNIPPSINTPQGYYGLTPNNQNQSFEMTQIPKTPLGLPRKSKSVNNGFSDICNMNNTLSGFDKSIEKVRRRKSEVDLKNHSPENAANRTIAETEASSLNVVSLGGARDSLMVETLTGVRKSSSAPTFQHSDNNSSNGNSSSNSGSSSNNNNSFSILSIWPMSVLNLTADIQAMSTVAITRPIFDGLPKPTSGRKKKALD